MILPIIMFCATLSVCAAQDITPYKFKEHPFEISHEVPASSRFTVARLQAGAPDIVYYLTKPDNKQSYPIALLCGGSSSKDAIYSIIMLHRYLLQEFLDLGCAVMTVEQWGVDGQHVDQETFMQHYTRSQRLQDHQTVIDYLRSNRPDGWDGTFVLLGVSEGGPLVTSLTEQYAHCIRATVNWCGAGDWSWDNELWEFMRVMRLCAPWYYKLLDWLPFSRFFGSLPKTRKKYDLLMQEIIKNPCLDKEYMGMTYLYHADALQYPLPDYEKITTPFLVVVGTADPVLPSSDDFVQKVLAAGAPVTYHRIEGMDHYVRQRPDVIEQTFYWLKNKLSV